MLARNAALSSGDPEMIADYRKRLSELPADTWVRIFRQELEALDQLEAGDVGAVKEMANRWSDHWALPHAAQPAPAQPLLPCCQEDQRGISPDS
jgi:hypothetical protein